MTTEFVILQGVFRAAMNALGLHLFNLAFSEKLWKKPERLRAE
jgi:hypothetical protein